MTVKHLHFESLFYLPIHKLIQYIISQHIYMQCILNGRPFLWTEVGVTEDGFQFGVFSTVRKADKLSQIHQLM